MSIIHLIIIEKKPLKNFLGGICPELAVWFCKRNTGLGNWRSGCKTWAESLALLLIYYVLLGKSPSLSEHSFHTQKIER